MTLTIRHPLTTTLGIAAAATCGWLAACAARLPQQYDQPATQHDELAERRRRQAKAMHPAHSTEPSNVVPFPTPNPAS